MVWKGRALAGVIAQAKMGGRVGSLPQQTGVFLWKIGEATNTAPPHWKKRCWWRCR